SAATPPALVEHARAHAAWLRSHAEGLADVSFTLARRRTHLPHRLVVIGRSAGELAERLEQYARTGTRDPMGEGALGDLARRHMDGATVDWGEIYPHGQVRTDLPPYPWQRVRHWISEAKDAPPAPV